MASNQTMLDKEVLSAVLSQRERVTGKKPAGTKAALPVIITYPPGYKKFSEVFGFVPPSGMDHAVIVHDVASWPVEARAFIPEKDPGYVFQPEETEMLVVGFMSGDKILAHGPKGSGKTTLPEQVCALLNWPFLCVNGRRDLETGQLLGMNSVDIDPVLKISEVRWHDGTLTEAARWGAVFLMDEIGRNMPGVNTCMQKVLEDNGVLYLADKPGTSTEKRVVPHKWFRFVATDNTALQGDVTGKYASTMVQDESLLDRFDTAIYLDYLSKDHELAVLAKRTPNTPEAIRKSIVQFAGLVRDAYKQGRVQFTLSLRGLIKWSKKVEYWGNAQRAFYFSFYNKLTDDDKKIVGELYNQAFGYDPNDFING